MADWLTALHRRCCHHHRHHRHHRHHHHHAHAQLLGNPIGKEGARALINLYESHEKIATLIGIKETDTALDLKGMYVDYVHPYYTHQYTHTRCNANQLELVMAH